MSNSLKGVFLLFASDPRCRYRANQLAEVICQLRFPEILSISAKLPVEFQDAIRSEFPRYSTQQEPAGPGGGTTTNYAFSSADGAWRVNVTGKFFALSCTQYDCWEQFAQKLDQPLAAFIRIYQPAYFERVGLRYLNFISRKRLDLEGCPFRELIAPCYLGILNEDDVAEANATRCSVDIETALRGGCRCKLHAGPGLVKRGGQGDQEVKFIFDQDLYMPGNVPVQHSAGALQTLHAQAYPIFRGAITDTLHQAMEPEMI